MSPYDAMILAYPPEWDGPDEPPEPCPYCGLEPCECPDFGDPVAMQIEWDSNDDPRML